MAAVDEDGEPHGSRAAELGERLQGGADGPAVEQDVVDEHDDLVVDPAGRDVGAGQRADRLVAQVVAVHRHVEAADGHVGALDLGHGDAETLGERHPAGRDAEQDEVVGTLVALEDLVGDPAQRPGDVAGGEHLTRGRAAGVDGRVSSVRAGWAAATT